MAKQCIQLQQVCQILECSHEYGAILSPDGTILYINRALLLTSGWNREDLIERPWLQTFAPAQNEAQKLILDWLAAGTATLPIEYAITLRNGSSHLISWNYTRIGAQEFNGIVLLGKDVTLERNITRSLAHLEKMATLGTLAAGMAHEINNPLAVIAGQTDLIRDHIESGAPKEKFEPSLRMQHNAIQRVRNLIYSLRNYARKEQANPMPFSLHEAIQESITFGSILLKGKPISLELRLSAKDPWINGFPTSLQQVILNLLHNSKDALLAQPGNTQKIITIETADCPTGGVTLTVQDNGPGMPEEILSRAFDQFFTTKEPGMGTGLGLSICAALIEEMKGTIHAESQPGQGCRFILQLPTCPAKKFFQPSIHSLPHSTAPLHGRILIVDDEEFLTDVLSMQLSALGLETQQARSAEEALEILKNKTPFDFVLTDMRMEKGTGMDLIDAIHKIPHHPKPKCILMSGHIEVDETTQIFPLNNPNVAAFLGKPFSREQLQDTLCRLQISAGATADPST